MEASNEELGELLDRIADLLAAQEAESFRVRAYRRAAETARAEPRALASLARQQGVQGLEALPGIGRSIAGLLVEYLHSGRCPLLDRLEGQISPEALLATVPGIGPGLAARIHAELDIDTLEELELAAHDGRLDALRGFGNRRTRAVRDAVGALLQEAGRRRGRRLRRLERAREGEGQARPAVATLLSVDAEYRAREAAGELRRLTPRRFNPRGEAWLPILHTQRDGWWFTALFSNTARAHELGRTRDWVVLYYERDGEEGQCTVVTERRGPQTGRRVVRGREAECSEISRGPETAPAPGGPRRNQRSPGRAREPKENHDGSNQGARRDDDPGQEPATQRPAEPRRRSDADGTAASPADPR